MRKAEVLAVYLCGFSDGESCQINVVAPGGRKRLDSAAAHAYNETHGRQSVDETGERHVRTLYVWGRRFTGTGDFRIDTDVLRGRDWPAFRSECLPAFAGRDEVRAWCAGCASGEEVYSLLMALRDVVSPESIRLLATDYDEGMLQACREGRYPWQHFDEIPKVYRRYLHSVGPAAKLWFRFSEELRSAFTTRRLDLLTDEYPAGFDIIFCRNVIKFFSPEAIAAVQRKLAVSLKEGGFLFLSRDGEGNDREMIPNPAALGLRQLDDRPIYRRV